LPPSILDQVRLIASDVFAYQADRIDTTSSPQTIESWDSVQHLNLVLALEDRFQVQLSPEDIERMQTIGDIANLLATKLKTISG